MKILFPRLLNRFGAVLRDLRYRRLQVSTQSTLKNKVKAFCYTGRGWLSLFKSRQD